jgi:hypothetical protein
LKKTLGFIGLLALASVGFVSCSGSYNNRGTSNPSKVKFRAFVSNPLLPTGTGIFLPVLNIIDATLDERSFSNVALTGVSASPGPMVLSPSKRLLLVLSTSDNTIAVIDPSKEAPASSSSSNVPSIRMPDVVTSMAVGADNATGFAAVPAAPVTGSSPGAVEVFSLSSGTITATLPVPGTRFVAVSHNGNRVVATRSDNCVTVITPSSVGTSMDPRTPVCGPGFDQPVWAVFSSDDTTAYVLNCGPECGGTAASVSQLDLTSNTITSTVPLNGAGATVGLLSGTTLYIAGTPPGTACGSGTSAPTCGTLITFDIGSMTVTSASPAVITDGVHDHIELGENGQLFIGAHSCTSVNTSGEIRGCLTIYDINKGGVVIPPAAGDVTGIQPITNRNVVYVCQNGTFNIYDTTTDQIALPVPGRVAIVFVGKAVDVKLVD